VYGIHSIMADTSSKFAFFFLILYCVFVCNL